MIPFYSTVVARVADAFADPAFRIFNVNSCNSAYGAAWNELYSALMQAEAPVLRQQVTYNLTANTTSLTPTTAGISNFGELYNVLHERPHGTTLHFDPLEEVDDLTQRDKGTALAEYVWRNDTWYFVGATQDTDILIDYMMSSDTAPANSTGFDDCFNFLWARTAALVGLPRGFKDLAMTYDKLARGPNLDCKEGYLADLINPMIRSQQRNPVQPRAYTADQGRRRRGRQWPYIPA